MVIAIVGAVDPQGAVDSVKQVLGDWDNPDQPIPPELPPVKPLKEQTLQRVEIPGKQ